MNSGKARGQKAKVQGKNRRRYSPKTGSRVLEKLLETTEVAPTLKLRDSLSLEAAPDEKPELRLDRRLETEHSLRDASWATSSSSQRGISKFGETAPPQPLRLRLAHAYEAHTGRPQ